MAQIYYGCMTKNADGANKIMSPGEKCLVPTDKCFWKDPQDIKNCGVQTRSRTKKEPTASIKAYRKYIEQKKLINHWILVSASENN